MRKSLFGRGGFRRVAPLVNQVVSFHPGHYYATGKRDDGEHVGWNGWNGSDWTNKTTLNEIINHPIVRGAVMQFQWVELEPTQGNYDFTLPDRFLNALSSLAVPRRFILQFNMRAFNQTAIFLPPYLLNSTYANGSWDYIGANANGRNLSLWNQALRNRLTALFTAIGNYYNTNPYFEGLCTVLESASGDPATATPNGTQQAAFYDGMLECTLAAKAALPNKNVWALMNYVDTQDTGTWPSGHDDDKMAAMISSMRAAGVGIGYPDTRLDDPGLNHVGGIYTNMQGAHGITPNVSSVQPSNYAYTGRMLNDPLYGHNAPTIDELYNDALTMFPNYIWWTRELPYQTDMLNYLDGLPSPAGGLITTAPTGYTGVDMG